MAAKKLVISLFFILAHFSDTEAQEMGNQQNYKKCNYAYWGLGWGGQKSARNFGFVSEIANNGVIAFAFQRTWLTELVAGPMIMSSTSPVKQTTSGALSILYGRIIKKDWGHYIFMGGPSVVGATRYDKNTWGYYSGESVSSVGLLLQAAVMPSRKFMGVGTNLFVNINSGFTHGGVTFNFVLGRVNDRNSG